MTKNRTIWIARDRDDAPDDKGLYLFNRKPCVLRDNGMWDADGEALQLPEEWFPEITYANSPQKVELKIVEK
jgi:hypothetical protein